MGLDVEIRKITKPNMDGSFVYDTKDIDLILLDKDELEMPMFCQLKPYVQLIQVRSHYYDIEKIRKDYKLSEDSYISAMTSHFIGITDNKNTKYITIDDYDISAKYTVDRIEPKYACKSEEICYWRKAYDIQDWFHDNIGGEVENTGFYILSAAKLLEFNKAFPDDRIEAIEPDEEEALFYWEWY